MDEALRQLRELLHPKRTNCVPIRRFFPHRPANVIDSGNDSVKRQSSVIQPERGGHDRPLQKRSDKQQLCLSVSVSKPISTIVVCKDIAVIASQCAHWRGNPPDEWNQVAITTKNRNVSLAEGQLSIHFPSNRGIATTSVRTGLAMTENFGAKR